MSKYKFQYRGGGITLAFAELVYDSNGYGGVESVIFYENGILSAYLSPKGVAQSRAIGLKLLDQSLFNSVLKDFDKLNQILLNYQPSDKSPEKDWLAVAEILKKFGDVYHYGEQPILAGLEEIFLASCQDQKTANEILADPVLADKFNLSDESKKALDIILKIGQIKLETHKNLEKINQFVMGLYGDLAKKYHLSLSQMFVMTNQEVKDMINGKPPLVDGLNRRLKGLAVQTGNGWHFLTSDEFLMWKEKIIVIDDKNIKGQVAYPGKASGKVKVHFDYMETANIAKGMVLVATMTNPQIVPLLKNVSAIVTDEGGLTCHAAIISRELKIPCIVGTGNATQVLKDGDEVEVDADEGVVRKLGL